MGLCVAKSNQDDNKHSFTIREKNRITETCVTDHRATTFENQDDLYRESEKERNERLRPISLIHKDKGNQYLTKKDYLTAIEEYTKAINCYSKESTYYSNRALCHKNLRNWEDVISDCAVALRLNQNNIKALHLAGVAYVEIARNQPCEILSIERGLELLLRAQDQTAKKSRDPNSSLATKDIQVKIKRGRKLLVVRQKEEWNKKVGDTMDFVDGLLKKHANNIEDDLKVDRGEIETSAGGFTQEEIMKDLKRFAETNTPKKFQVTDLPDIFFCKISYDLLKEPKMTPDGITYEEEYMRQHFEKVGFFDPITRMEIDFHSIIPNKTLQIALDHYYELYPMTFENDYVEDVSTTSHA